MPASSTGSWRRLPTGDDPQSKAEGIHTKRLSAEAKLAVRASWSFWPHNPGRRCWLGFSTFLAKTPSCGQQLWPRLWRRLHRPGVKRRNIATLAARLSDPPKGGKTYRSRNQDVTGHLREPTSAPSRRPLGLLAARTLYRQLSLVGALGTPGVKIEASETQCEPSRTIRRLAITTALA